MRRRSKEPLARLSIGALSCALCPPTARTRAKFPQHHSSSYFNELATTEQSLQELAELWPQTILIRTLFLALTVSEEAKKKGYLHWLLLRIMWLSGLMMGPKSTWSPQVLFCSITKTENFNTVSISGCTEHGRWKKALPIWSHSFFNLFTGQWFPIRKLLFQFKRSLFGPIAPFSFFSPKRQRKWSYLLLLSWSSSSPSLPVYFLDSSVLDPIANVSIPHMVSPFFSIVWCHSYICLFEVFIKLSFTLCLGVFFSVVKCTAGCRCNYYNRACYGSQASGCLVSGGRDVETKDSTTTDSCGSHIAYDISLLIEADFIELLQLNLFHLWWYSTQCLFI